MKLDIMTVMLAYVIVSFINAGVVFLLWRQNGKRYQGLDLWLAAHVMQFFAILSLAARNVLPGLIVVLLGNGLLVLSTVVLLMGLERFCDRRGPHAQNFILLAVFLCVQAYFFFIVPSLTAREISISAVLLVMFAQLAFLMLRRAKAEMRRGLIGAGIVFLSYCAASVMRILVDALVPPGNDFFNSSVYDAFVLMTYGIISIALTFTLVLVANRRLFQDIQTDIEMRRRVERILVLRLTLWEYSASHSVDELMQKALDEIEEIVGSPIGFYHFVEDKRLLSLHAWSTRTLREFCSAEGTGMHYDLDRAGVWADAVRSGKPVIHNDYASLSGRKGMPQGHAAIVRELVVPTLRDGVVVSVLGVGNKRTDYDDKDVAFLSSIADIVWTIIDRKRTEEKIKELQDRLRDMAIHDSLTGLYNRHYLDDTLKRELSRAEREGYPIGFVMMDLDHFKQVNDTFGHKAGDEVLTRFADHLRANSRASDIIYRYGGEEYLAVLPGVGMEQAFQTAEKWRKGFAEIIVNFEGTAISVSISCGVSAFPAGGADGEEVIRCADKALYRAKGAGRNRTMTWTAA